MPDQLPNDPVPSQGEATRLLIAWGNGDKTALDKLVPLVLTDLRKRANCILRGQPPGHLLQTDGLVNEAFIKIVEHSATSWRNRAHFLAVAAKAMRQILIDHARSRLCAGRSGAWTRLPEDQAVMLPADNQDALIALEDALRKLGEHQPRAGAVLELRCFVGATVDEIAQILGISRITALRDWKAATDFLRRELSSS
jgi:RNA polymerase sigma-70 factor, ECF subfamily